MNILGSLAKVTTRHPVITILVVLGVTLLALIPASNFTIDSSVEGFFGSDDPDVKMVQAVRDQFGEQELVTVVIDCSDSDPSAAEAYGQSLIEELEKDPRWRDIQYVQDLSFAGEKAILYVPEEYLAALTNPYITPEMLDGFRAAILDEINTPKYIVSDNGKIYLVNVGVDIDINDTTERESLFDDLGELINDTREKSAEYKSLEVGFTGGMSVIDYEGDKMVMRDFFRTAILTLIFILALLIVAFRSFSTPVLAAVPLLVGIVWTVGVMFLLYDSLHLLSVMFAAMILGIGIDYCIHALTRFTNEMEEHDDVELAFVHTFSRTGKAIILGSVTTAAAFFSYYFAEIQGLHQLGVIGAVGLLMTLMAVFVLLPALVTLRLRFRKLKRSRGTFSVLGKVGSLVQRFAPTFLVTMAALLIFFGVRAPNAELGDDMYAVMPTETESFRQLEKVKANFDYDADYLTCVVGSESGLGHYVERFEDEDEVVKVESIYDYLPDNQDQKLELIRQAIEVHPELAAAPWINVSPIRWDELPHNIRQAWVSDGDFLIKITPKRSVYSRSYQQELLPQLREIHPNVTADAVMFTKMADSIAHDMIRLSLYVTGVLLVIVYLGTGKRNPIYAVLAMIPVGFGILGLMASYSWFGIELMAFSICTIPLIIGIGIDDGIHITHRYLEEGKGSLPRVTRLTGKAIFLTTATTCLAFASFLFSNHPALNSIGLVPIIGLILCFLAAILFLPALLRVIVDR